MSDTDIGTIAIPPPPPHSWHPSADGASQYRPVITQVQVFREGTERVLAVSDGGVTIFLCRFDAVTAAHLASLLGTV